MTNPADLTPSALVDRIEKASSLDAATAPLHSFWATALKPAWLKDLLSGRPLGHPAHPVGVSVTAGVLLSASVLDVIDDDRAADASQRLIGIGLVSAVPTVLAGWSDWVDTEQAEKRVGLVHATSNAVGLTAYLVSWLRRRGGHSGRLAGVVGAGALRVGGWLGGHLVYAQGVGVDTTAFQTGPTTWTDVAASSRVTDALRQVDVGGVAVLLSRVDGSVVAIADRCTHRGAPLSDGERVGDCVDCPWHGSRFDLATGEVRRGPATRPQPVYEARERDGRVEIRRHEERALRSNPVGA